MKHKTKEERQKTIINELLKYAEVKVNKLSEQLETSEVTIRKDLAILEQQQQLIRCYGGARLKQTTPAPPLHSPYKHCIAQLAATLVKDNSRLIIDSGDTASALIPELNHKQHLIIMTNSLNVANQILNLSPQPTLLMTGGTWDPTSKSFQGKVAKQTLSAYDFDQLFIGADGLDLDKGTTSFQELLSLSQTMAQRARQVIVMIEADKIDRKIPNLELPWEAITTVITDHRINTQTKQHIIKRGVNVLCATPQNTEGTPCVE